MESDSDHAPRNSVDVIVTCVRHVQSLWTGRNIVEKAELEFREIDSSEWGAVASIETTNRIHVDDPQRVADDRHAARRMERGSACATGDESEIVDCAFRAHAGNEAVVILRVRVPGSPVTYEVDVLVGVVANSFGGGETRWRCNQPCRIGLGSLNRRAIRCRVARARACGEDCDRDRTDETEAHGSPR